MAEKMKFKKFIHERRRKSQNVIEEKNKNSILKKKYKQKKVLQTQWCEPKLYRSRQIFQLLPRPHTYIGYI